MPIICPSPLSPLTLPSPQGERGIGRLTHLQGCLRISKKVAAWVEEADQAQLIRRRRVEAPEPGRDGEIPAAGRARRLHRLRLGPVAEDARESQRALLRSEE